MLVDSAKLGKKADRKKLEGVNSVNLMYKTGQLYT